MNYTKISIIGLLFLISPLSALFGQEEKYAGKTCNDCHESYRSSCDRTCNSCHLDEKGGKIPERGHPAVILNPSAAAHRDAECGKCHAGIVRGMEKDVHTTNADIIAQTRFLWGAAKSLGSAHLPMEKLEKNIPDKEKITPADLADNFLRKKCLACHLETEGCRVAGMHRAAGCAACHIEKDQKTGKSLHGHKFVRDVPDSQCLTCHGGNHAGGDYYGYYEMDYHESYQMPYGSKPIFGAWQHRLDADVHQKAGMKCTDCHILHEKKTRSCEDCHGGYTGTDNIKDSGAPRFDSSLIPHEKFHSRLRCEGCHARWSYQDYGLHLMLDMSEKGYGNWKGLKWQGDPEITRLLLRELSKAKGERLKPVTTDWVSGEKTPGAWFKGYSLRRWEDPPLGVDENDRIGVLRPLHQYFVTYVDKNNKVILDSEIPKRADGKKGWAFRIYTPHTIGISRSCESCHNNPKAGGTGIHLPFTGPVADSITVASPPLPGQRLLDREELRRMGHTSKLYREKRAAFFLRSKK